MTAQAGQRTHIGHQPRMGATFDLIAAGARIHQTRGGAWVHWDTGSGPTPINGGAGALELADGLIAEVEVYPRTIRLHPRYAIGGLKPGHCPPTDVAAPGGGADSGSAAG